MDPPESTCSTKNTMESLPDEVKSKPYLKDEEFARGPRNTNGAGCAKVLSWKRQSLFSELKTNMRGKWYKIRLEKGRGARLDSLVRCFELYDCILSGEKLSKGFNQGSDVNRCEFLGHHCCWCVEVTEQAGNGCKRLS